VTALAHRTQLAPVVVSVTIRLDIGPLFWPLFALVWLAWLGVARLGKWLTGCREWWTAAGVVAKRRFRRWVDSWKADLDLMGLAVGELMGGNYGPIWA
jgi:hypothetical protein